MALTAFKWVVLHDVVFTVPELAVRTARRFALKEAFDPLDHLRLRVRSENSLGVEWYSIFDSDVALIRFIP